MPGFKKELRLAKEIASGAGRILRQGINKKSEVHLKGRVDLVTEYDLKSERYIKRQIDRVFPTHAILAEERFGNFD